MQVEDTALVHVMQVKMTVLQWLWMQVKAAQGIQRVLQHGVKKNVLLTVMPKPKLCSPTIHGISVCLNRRLRTHRKIKTDANGHTPKLKRAQTDARSQETHVIAHNTPCALTPSAICREALASNVRACNSGEKHAMQKNCNGQSFFFFEPMTIFALALHDTTRAHSLSEIFLLMYCIKIQKPWAIPVIVSGTVSDYPRHLRQLFLHKYTRERKNGHSPKSKQTQTDAPKSQNRRKRTGAHIKTDANAMYHADFCFATDAIMWAQGCGRTPHP